jgi:probable F420-dependent oxidoreductase
MRFHYADAMIDPSFFMPLAKALEAAGWHGMTIPDSICYPEVSDSKYPYTPDGNREFLEDKPFLEPMSLIPALAAVTEKLTFTTFVVKLPIRHPVLVAKSISSVSVLSGGRLNFGVGISPWPDDYRVLQVPYKARGKRMNECIEIIRGLEGGGYFAFEGEVYSFESIKICPVPEKPTPILLGGHSEAALKRAARLGDGWLHAGGNADELQRLLIRLEELRRDYGTADKPFTIGVISMDAYKPDGVKRLSDMGVTDVIVGFRNSYAMAQDTESLERKVASLNMYAERVIAVANNAT